MLGKRLKYSQAKIIWDKTSKYDTNRMGKRNLIAITIGNKNLLRKKLLNSNNINRKE